MSLCAGGAQTAASPPRTSRRSVKSAKCRINRSARLIVYSAKCRVHNKFNYQIVSLSFTISVEYALTKAMLRHRLSLLCPAYQLHKCAPTSRPNSFSLTFSLFFTPFLCYTAQWQKRRKREAARRRKTCDFPCVNAAKPFHCISPHPVLYSIIAKNRRSHKW